LIKFCNKNNKNFRRIFLFFENQKVKIFVVNTLIFNVDIYGDINILLKIMISNMRDFYQ